MGKHSVVVKREKRWGSVSSDLRIGLAAGQAISAATRRRSARRIGAAAGGLLSVAFMPAAAAFADDYTITADPTSQETVTGIYGTGLGGADTAPPAVAGSLQGHQTFDYTDTASQTTGTFTGDENTVTDGFADTNSEVLVTSDLTGADAPPVGSVFDTYTFDDGTETNIYSAIPSATGGDTITDTLVTPYGDYTIPMTFDAADVTAADANGLSLSDGDFVPQGSLAVNAITGIPPLTMALQGTQTFDSSANTGFNADVTTTTDGVGTYTEAVLVTSDSAGSTVGTAAGDVPGVGSVFNTMDLFGDEEVYSDIVTPSGNVITDTIETPLGDYTIPTTFDATEAESAGTVDLGDGDSLVGIGTFAKGTEALTGVNGLPPVDVGVQGTDTYDFDEGSTVAGTFTGDYTNTEDMFGGTTQTVLVTGNVTGDAPQAGSVIETVGLGNGYENIYSDIIGSSGAATITDTLVTPFGSYDIPDASEFALVVPNLTADMFSGI
jgi:hypothetical protein